jgi:tetratricopeptide (TPR) repeat protein
LVRFLAVIEDLSPANEFEVAEKIAECYYRMGQYKESIPYYEKAGEYYTSAQVYDLVGDYENAFRLYFDTQEDEDKNFALARRALGKVTDPGFLRESALGYYYVDDYERALLLFEHLGGFAALEGFCYAFEGAKEKVFACWERCRTIGEFVMIAEGCLEKELVYLGAEFFLAIPFRENPDWTPRFHLDRTPGAERKAFDTFVFTIPLENTSIVDLMKAHFMEQPGDYEKIKNEDKSVTEKRKREMSIWGHLLMEEDIGFDNIEMITNYLEKSGDYNTLLLHFKTFKRMEPERFKETAKKVQKNMPSARGINTNEAIVFRRMLLGEMGELTVQEGDDMNKRFPKMTVRRNNFILFLSNVVKEEYRHKARAYCTANGLGLEHDGYLDYLMDEPGKEEDKKKN